MTVIWSNHEDYDTLSLKYIWATIPNVNVVEITPNMIDEYEELVDDAIAKETDTLILCGHGTTHGLLHPNFDSGCYLVHENNINLIHCKNLILIWCHASTFAEKHKLSCFATSMFISNLEEAYNNCIYDTDEKRIMLEDDLFSYRVNELLLNDTPLNEWVMILGAKADLENGVVQFNYQGLNYFDYS